MPKAINASPVSCDLFCKVIDNLGDAGVCWRLARQLVREYGWHVRLWINDPQPLDQLAPDRAHIPIDVRYWSDDFPGVEPANVVIESFASNLPPRYLAAMSARPCPPVWINLEYLSTEEWAVGCHGLPSPQQGLQKYFFFPGFVSGTGGLLKERDYSVPPASTSRIPLTVSMFCYTNPALSDLLDAWRDGDTPVVCHIAAGVPQRQVAEWLCMPFASGHTAEQGRLTLHALPFLPQDDYDHLLARCDLNFVRGEDSFVRAQWAEQPFVWQAYVQEDGAHLAKLDAFLALTRKGDAGDTVKHHFWHAWNGDGQIDWPSFAIILPQLSAEAHNWARKISAHGDLAGNLVKFCASRL